MTSGTFDIQKRGKVKWTTLSRNVVMCWGDDYKLTRGQALRVARRELANRRKADPTSTFRIRSATWGTWPGDNMREEFIT